MTIRHAPIALRRLSRALLVLPLLLGGCAVHDAYVADEAQSKLIGLSELDLESCLGVPDQHQSFGSSDVLTYYTTSSSSTSLSIPIVGGIGLAYGGNCHATFRIDDNRVTRILYSGEKNATGAPNAYCVPIVRSCMAYLNSHPPSRVPAPPAGPARPGAGATGGTVAPGGVSAAPQPGTSTAALPSDVPTATPR